MKFPNFSSPGRPPATAPTVDSQAIQRTIEQALDAAGLGSASSARMKDVLDLIQRSLGGAAPASDRSGAAASAPPEATVIDVVAREVGAPPIGTHAGRAPRTAHGRAIGGKHTGAAGSRLYQVYLPASAGEAPMPLMVMLHGCTQSPDDFAAGTRMNELAERDGFIVVYPAQSQNANGSKCWNWFRAGDQARDGGEPALIAGIVRDVAEKYPVDRSRIFVAGLSAGGAMAVILGQTYPELFAAIGVHSGLAYGAAHDVPTAFAAMGGDPQGNVRPPPSAPFVPTIVFHGDRDSTVKSGNGLEVVAQALARERRSQPGEPLLESIDVAAVPGGQRYTRIVHSDATGRPKVERWLLHGAGHAWSGGSPAGSYTDPAGPDASEAMLRFFMAQGGRQSPT